MNRKEEERNPDRPDNELGRNREQEGEEITREEAEHIAPPPREPRVGDDYRHHPKPVPGVDMPGEVPGDDLQSGGRKDGMGYDHGSADGRRNDRFWSSEEERE